MCSVYTLMTKRKAIRHTFCRCKDGSRDTAKFMTLCQECGIFRDDDLPVTFLSKLGGRPMKGTDRRRKSHRGGGGTLLQFLESPVSLSWAET